MAGWVFEDWRGGQFYPPDLRQKDELAYASRAVTTIEINATFYSTQKPASFRNWAAQVPPGFVFTVKGPRVVTHIKKLNDVRTPLANFFASGVLALGAYLGPFCWQLPPNLAFGRERMEAFIRLLPHTAAELQSLAAEHDERIATPFLETDGIGPVRHAIEVRHPSFATAECIDLFRAHNVALVTADTADWPYADQTATDFSYLRLQGAPGAEQYTAEQRDDWADRLLLLAAGKDLAGSPLIAPPMHSEAPRDVFGFFVSTDKPNAPRNALAVMERLGVKAETD